jgi:excisionase family DNA binding protein
MSAHSDLERLLTPAQAARLVGVTPDRLRQLSDTGKLPATRTPLGRLFARADVERLRQQRQTKFGSESLVGQVGLDR